MRARTHAAGEFAPHGVGGATFETLGHNGYREGRRIGDQQMDGEVGAHRAHGVLGVGEHGVGEQFAPVFGHEDKLGVQQQRHAVAVVAVGRLCQWSPLRLCCG